MNLNKNIADAFEVVRKTYENVDKLMRYCDSIADKNGYMIANSKFLRYKSDHVSGWCIDSFIKVYQSKKDKKLGNGWRNGPLYVIEINFQGDPFLVVAALEYNDMKDWNGVISPADHWVIYYPLLNGIERFTHSKIDNEYTLSVPDESIMGKYWGLKRAIYTETELTLITSDNIEEKVFRQFEQLQSKIANK